MAAGRPGWLADSMYDWFGYYAPAFVAAIVANLLNIGDRHGPAVAAASLAASGIWNGRSARPGTAGVLPAILHPTWKHRAVRDARDPDQSRSTDQRTAPAPWLRSGPNRMARSSRCGCRLTRGDVLEAARRRAPLQGRRRRWHRAPPPRSHWVEIRNVLALALSGARPHAIARHVGDRVVRRRDKDRSARQAV